MNLHAESASGPQWLKAPDHMAVVRQLCVKPGMWRVFRLVATSLSGEVLAKAEDRFEHGKGPRHGIAALAGAMLRLIEQLDPVRHRVIGIGLAFPRVCSATARSING